MITDSKTRVGPWAGEESRVNPPHGHYLLPLPPPTTSNNWVQEEGKVLDSSRCQISET